MYHSPPHPKGHPVTRTRPLHELAGLLPVRSATTDLPHYAEAEGAPAVCARQTGRRLTGAEAAAAPRFCSQCVKVAEKLVALDAESAEPASPLIDAARTFADSVEFRQRNAEILTLAEAVGQVLVHGLYVFEPHYAVPGATSTLCREDTVSRELNDEQSARVSILCGECEKAARLQSERLISEAREAASEAGARVRTDPDPTNPEWVAALERLTVALDFLTKHDPVTSEAITAADKEITDELAVGEPTEGDVLITALAKLGRHAYPGGEGGVTFVILAAAPDAPNDPTFPYDRPHVLLYAGEQADRPASRHREPWSAHLHGADGDYVATLNPNFTGRLNAADDATRVAREVDEWLRAFHGPA
ncbi:hypothetical protein M2168_002200 [Streptomyces sp. CZ24]|nr:hypothetical protein [Streptomyces sp. CZ24]